ncbi:MAG TPA: OmpH family outer membrane protein [Bacteroidota bacterium]|nr:OmpH family outer membrane protein [Bacteroidota bacterium]
MKTRMFLLCLVLAVLVAVPQAFTQSQKIGYVNSAKIFQELPAAQDAQRRIDALSKPVQDSLEAMQRDLQARYEDYQKREALLNDAAKKSEQQKLIETERRMNEYRVQKLGNDGDLARETEKLLNPLRERIKNAIAAVAREEKYSFVFDKTETIQILLYGDPTHDITFKVIDRLKRGK